MGVSNAKSKFWSNDDDGMVVFEQKKPADDTSSASSDDEKEESSSERTSPKTSLGTTTNMTDFDFLKSITTSKNDLDDDSDNDDSKSDHDDTHVAEEQLPQAFNNRLFVRNLPFATSEEDLRDHFVEKGRFHVTECHIPLDDQKRNKGFAFVRFSSKYDAQKALDMFDRTDFQGRLMHVLPARESTHEQNDVVGNTHKQQREHERRKEAMNHSDGWLASHVRGDAVLDGVAARLGIQKGDLFDDPVRLALGETHVIQENRRYFANHGIDMDATTDQRSNKALLVKNLPFDTQQEELTKLFRDAQRVLLPPSRTIALVEYDHAVDARRAFKKHAYKRFKHVPLYLEWAPLLTHTTTTQENKKDKEEDDEDDDDDDAGVGHSIYVKNLNFSTTEDALREFFKQVSVRAVKIPTKGVQKRNQEVAWLSMGYGFVECETEACVKTACRVLQGAVLDGHALELKPSSKTIVPAKKKKKQTCKKIMVRNVPFQATRPELLQLFGSYGQLKRVRLPKKFRGGHRGFAFVEFLTHQEAQEAMEALSRTHLYGRHLVLEWAEEEEEMEKLRIKAQRDMDRSKQQPNKKTRFEY